MNCLTNIESQLVKTKPEFRFTVGTWCSYYEQFWLTSFQNKGWLLPFALCSYVVQRLTLSCVMPAFVQTVRKTLSLSPKSFVQDNEQLTSSEVIFILFIYFFFCKLENSTELIKIASLWFLCFFNLDGFEIFLLLLLAFQKPVSFH